MPLYKNVDGAPFKIGDKIKVLNNPNNDETFNKLFISKSGLVIYYDYECGCGQNFPDDPMIGVRFENGIVEEYWKEEIKTTT
jgi:hypothetical protein